MLLSSSKKLFLIASLLTLVRAQLQQGLAQGVVFPNQEQQTLLPALADPRKSACAIQYVNGKKIIPANNNPADCQREINEQAKVRKAQAIELAAKAIKMAETTPSQAPKCVKSVDVRETVCIKNKILNDIKTKPTYTVTGEENKIYIHKNGKVVMEAINIQNHFAKKEKPVSKQEKIIEKAKDAYVFNEIGEVLSTKQTKKRKTPECICPSPNVPRTLEGHPMINECHRAECKNYDLFINIFSNTSIAEAPPSDKASEKKDDSKDKKNGKDDSKEGSGSSA